MSEKINDGGAAFPDARISIYDKGVTVRDYFAAKALSGMIANATAKLGQGCEATNAAFAQVAYLLADAMLEERAK